MNFKNLKPATRTALKAFSAKIKTHRAASKAAAGPARIAHIASPRSARDVARGVKPRGGAKATHAAPGKTKPARGRSKGAPTR